MSAMQPEPLIKDLVKAAVTQALDRIEAQIPAIRKGDIVFDTKGQTHWRPSEYDKGANYVIELTKALINQERI